MNRQEILDSLEPDFREVVEIIEKKAENDGVAFRWTQGRRTIATQNALYAEGRTAPGRIVTKAAGGSSAHNFGLAVDFVLLNSDGSPNWDDEDPKWAKVGAIAEAQGMIWGGHFHSITDKPHIEHPRWRVAQANWKAGKIKVA